MKNSILTFITLVTFSACAQKPKAESPTTEKQVSSIEKIEKSESEWKSILTADEYYVLREKGTERAFTSDLLNIKDKGTYVCAACKLPLFESETKFKSGTGWPSFYEPTNNENVAEESDQAYGMVRTEVLCARCDGHLGHVFPDGPKPSGLRYCINGNALKFEKKDE